MRHHLHIRVPMVEWQGHHLHIREPMVEWQGHHRARWDGWPARRIHLRIHPNELAPWDGWRARRNHRNLKCWWLVAAFRCANVPMSDFGCCNSTRNTYPSDIPAGAHGCCEEAEP